MKGASLYMDQQHRDKLQLIATKTFKQYDEMYKVVDFLNKTLKNKNVMFGLTKNNDGSMTVTVYET